MAYHINQVSLRQALCQLPMLVRMNATVRFMVWGNMTVGAFIGGARERRGAAGSPAQVGPGCAAK